MAMALNYWCRLRDLNPRPSDYKSDALPTELSRLNKEYNTRKYSKNKYNFAKVEKRAQKIIVVSKKPKCVKYDPMYMILHERPIITVISRNYDR